MSDPAPSDKFLFFQPSRVFERLIIPGCFITVFSWMLYIQRGLTYALYLTPGAYWLAVAACILACSALTLISLNTHWAYEGCLTRWQTRPWKKFNAGSKWWCVSKHGVVFFLSLSLLSVFFTQALPHGLLLYTGAPEVSELVVQSKGKLRSKYKRSCFKLVEASTIEYRSDKLCLKSDQLYAELNVGDTLIVEGRANWIGLLVDRPIALRDAESGLERSVRTIPRQQPVVAQLNDQT